MNAKALSVQDPSSLKHMDLNDSCSTPRKEMQNGALTKVESVYGYSKVSYGFSSCLRNCMNIFTILLRIGHKSNFANSK